MFTKQIISGNRLNIIIFSQTAVFSFIIGSKANFVASPVFHLAFVVAQLQLHFNIKHKIIIKLSNLSHAVSVNSSQCIHVAHFKTTEVNPRCFDISKHWHANLAEDKH